MSTLKGSLIKLILTVAQMTEFNHYISRNSLDPYYLVPHCHVGHIPSLFGSRWVVGYQVVGALRVPRIRTRSTIPYEL